MTSLIARILGAPVGSVWFCGRVFHYTICFPTQDSFVDLCQAHTSCRFLPSLGANRSIALSLCYDDQRVPARILKKCQSGIMAERNEVIILA